MGFDPASPWLQQAVEKGLVGATEKIAESRPPAFAAPAFANESEFQTAVINLARILGWRVAHFRKVRVQRKGGSTYWETPVAADGKGFPDLELVRERLVKAELKVGGNRPTPEQSAWLAAYAAAGVEAYVWYPADWAELVAVLTRRQTGKPVPSPRRRSGSGRATT